MACISVLLVLGLTFWMLVRRQSSYWEFAQGDLSLALILVFMVLGTVFVMWVSYG